MKANLLSLLIPLALAVVLLTHGPPISWTTPRIVGAMIFACALPLFVLARLQLGASFSVTAQARKLVTTGLYSRIRNPIYLFGGLIGIGMSLFVRVWGPLLVAAVLIPLQTVRARKEEQVLRQAFGEEYDRYKQQTWF